MLKGKQIKGLRVIALGGGKELGRVEDLLINTETGMVAGLMLENRSILKTGKIINLKDIVSVGRDAVIISGGEAVRDDEQDLEDKYSWQDRLEKNIFTRDGQDIGTVQDIFIELPEGRVMGIELSGGIWADLHQGRKMISWQAIVPGKGENLIADLGGDPLWS